MGDLISIEAVRDLVNKGYMNLQNYRDMYKRRFNRATILTDDEIIDIVANQRAPDEPTRALQMFELEQKKITSGELT